MMHSFVVVGVWLERDFSAGQDETGDPAQASDAFLHKDFNKSGVSIIFMYGAITENI